MSESHEPTVEAGSLPTHSVGKEERVILVRSLLVDWKVLDHLQQHAALGAETAQMMRANCCAPDGGSCCVNMKRRGSSHGRPEM